MSGRALLRVAAAESPGIKWGSLDVSTYDAAAESPAEALSFDTSRGDVFGTSRQARLHYLAVILSGMISGGCIDLSILSAIDAAVQESHQFC